LKSARSAGPACAPGAAAPPPPPPEPPLLLLPAAAPAAPPPAASSATAARVATLGTKGPDLIPTTSKCVVVRTETWPEVGRYTSSLVVAGLSGEGATRGRCRRW
jgi:hypothetical protein